MVAITDRRLLLIMLLLVLGMGSSIAAPDRGGMLWVADAGWSTQAVSRAMAEIRTRHGGSMLRQQSSGDTLLVQWKTRSGVRVFVIEPQTGRWYPASRRDAHPGR